MWRRRCISSLWKLNYNDDDDEKIRIFVSIIYIHTLQAVHDLNKYEKKESELTVEWCWSALLEYVESWLSVWLGESDSVGRRRLSHRRVGRPCRIFLSLFFDFVKCLLIVCWKGANHSKASFSCWLSVYDVISQFVLPRFFSSFFLSPPPIPLLFIDPTQPRDTFPFLLSSEEKNYSPYLPTYCTYRFVSISQSLSHWPPLRRSCRYVHQSYCCLLVTIYSNTFWIQ